MDENVNIFGHKKKTRWLTQINPKAQGRINLARGVAGQDKNTI
jgi:hypothetical protein